jgi:uncharacterized protein (TIGR03083 family)
METSRYLDCLAADYKLLRDAATSAGIGAPVPSCPGWTVADLVSHTGEVYLHKATVIRDQKWPDPWPPEDAPADPFASLDLGYREVTAEFASRPPDEQSLTWYAPQQTVGFWIRRMAQETVVHRMDAQLAAGVPVTQAPDDLAVDGVDEVLHRFLAYGSAEWPGEYATVNGGHLAGDAGTDTILVTAGAAAWTVRPTPHTVSVTDGGDRDTAVAVVSAPPDAMLRWLWGRADDEAGEEAVTVGGDPEWAAYLRRLLAAMTG